jgi:uncharacterized protein (TIGR02271 family)
MDRWNIREGAEVRSSDDEKLGKVVAFESNYIVVEKGFFFPTDYYIPTSAIANADGDTIYLSVGKDQALNSGWDQMVTTDTTYADDTVVGETFQTEAVTNYDTTATAGTTGTIAAGYDAAGTTGAAATDEVLHVPVHEEELAATKRTVEQGQVRIDKDVIAEERTLDVPVTEERVRVTRRVVDREGTADADAFTEGTIEVPVRGEEVDLQKRVRVAEEVEISKEAVQRTETVGGTVRREEVHVEDQTIDAGFDAGRDNSAR